MDEGYALKGNVEAVKGDKKALKVDGEALNGDGEALKNDYKGCHSVVNWKWEGVNVRGGWGGAKMR